ncbi:MAG TPA: protein kinase, partial [Gammaproteobacteria bacterium]|nr:protein kinase [Gammaproteobacteria bacterium]
MCPAPDPKREISLEEWQLAEEFFRDNPTTTKFFRKPKSKKTGSGDPLSNQFLKAHGKPEGVAHSFVKIGQTIYALQANGYLGKGGFGAVKRGYTKDPETVVAVKIQLGEIGAEQRAESNVLKFLGRSTGDVAQRVPQKGPKGAPHDVTFKKKTYLTDQFNPGQDLLKALKQSTFSEIEKFDIAIQCAQILQYLHNQGILHGDVALRNFMISPDFKVIAIDFGNAMRIRSVDDHKLHFKDIPYGELHFGGDLSFDISRIVPENTDGKTLRIHETFDTYCFHSVLDSLGIQFDSKKMMTDPDPFKRPTMSEIITQLQQQKALFEISAAKGASNTQDLPDIPPDLSIDSDLDLPGLPEEEHFAISELEAMLTDFTPDALLKLSQVPLEHSPARPKEADRKKLEDAIEADNKALQRAVEIQTQHFETIRRLSEEIQTYEKKHHLSSTNEQKLNTA